MKRHHICQMICMLIPEYVKLQCPSKLNICTQYLAISQDGSYMEQANSRRKNINLTRFTCKSYQIIRIPGSQLFLLGFPTKKIIVQHQHRATIVAQICSRVSNPTENGVNMSNITKWRFRLLKCNARLNAGLLNNNSSPVTFLRVNMCGTNDSKSNLKFRFAKWRPLGCRKKHRKSGPCPLLQFMIHYLSETSPFYKTGIVL